MAVTARQLGAGLALALDEAEAEVVRLRVDVRRLEADNADLRSRLADRGHTIEAAQEGAT